MTDAPKTDSPKTGSAKTNGPYDIRLSREVYANPWVRVREEQVIHRPSGRDGVYGVINLRDGSTTLAIDDDDHVYLVKEFKYAMGRESIELVSGGIDDGEEPLQTAKRELAEEVGLAAARWTLLGVTEPFTTVMPSRNYLFLAENLSTAEARPDVFEQIEILRVPFEEALTMARDGRITHAASCICLLRVALLRHEA